MGLRAASVAAVVAAERSEPEPELDPGVRAALDLQVDKFIGQARALAGQPGEQTGLVEALASLGARDVRANAALSSRMLERPAAAIRALSGEAGSVGRGLDELRSLASSLQEGVPAGSGGPRRRLFGLVRAANPVDSFITRSERAQAKVNAVLGGLLEAQQGLRSENAAVGQDLVALETQAEALRRHAYMAARIDEGLAAGSAPTDMVFAVRQRRRDLLSQLAVAMQGRAALRVVEENNAELIRAIEGATTTTAAALRTSTLVMQAVLTQRMVRARLDEARTAAQGGASGSAAQLQNLKQAWAGVDATLEQVQTFRSQALISLAGSAGALAAAVETPRRA